APACSLPTTPHHHGPCLLHLPPPLLSLIVHIRSFSSDASQTRSRTHGIVLGSAAAAAAAAVHLLAPNEMNTTICTRVYALFLPPLLSPRGLFLPFPTPTPACFSALPRSPPLVIIMLFSPARALGE